ncbi:PLASMODESMATA CALLOSE-BINDING PROTEIN 3-like isoform X1 [Telopea speciosissima]|uniref:PLASMODESMATA CALLOSE-BINDING PROTEIN 3-like isoform X1 n=1 Tax=Telopea speciosissima TaxID=54955 RepID=UPI001CC34ACC|nr:PLASMODESMATA CALLOSE-BINDING PROTEIN 3-like isoform X1 [Telopea speciosissima]
MDTVKGSFKCANWCVCRSDVSDTALQKTLDYACGAGADCTPILQNGACYQPNTVRGHCSYAANSYFQKKGQSQGTCDFAGTAQVSTNDPSPGGTCTFPATASAAGTSTTPTTGTPTTTTPTTGTTTSTTPTTSTGGTTPTTTSGGIIGGIGSGLGPSGVGINSDTTSDGGRLSFQQHNFFFFFFISLLPVFWFSGLHLLWG